MFTNYESTYKDWKIFRSSKSFLWRPLSKGLLFILRRSDCVLSIEVRKHLLFDDLFDDLFVTYL